MVKNNNICMGIIFLLGVLILINTISAQDYVFKVGQSMNFKAACTYLGAPCNISAGCNLTLQNSTGGYTLDNVIMTHHTNGDFSYVIPAQVIGNFNGKVFCSQGGYSYTTPFTLDVTPTGDNRGVGLFLILALGSFILLVMALLLKNEYLGFITGALFITTGIYTMIYGVGPLSDMYTRTIGYSSIGLGLIFLVASAYSAIESGKINILGSDDDDF